MDLRVGSDCKFPSSFKTRLTNKLELIMKHKYMVEIETEFDSVEEVEVELHLALDATGADKLVEVLQIEKVPSHSSS